eukprot:g1736.t1
MSLTDDFIKQLSKSEDDSSKSVYALFNELDDDVVFSFKGKKKDDDDSCIRPASIKDIPAVHEMIRGLAAFEKQPDAVKVTSRQFALDFLRSNFILWVVQDVTKYSDTQESWNESLLGFALCFYSYSTWTGKTLYLEDLFIKPSFRSQGFGTSLLKAIVNHALEQGCARLQWQVLSWNEKAISYYKKFARERIEDDGTSWLNYIMDETLLKKFANEK